VDLEEPALGHGVFKGGDGGWGGRADWSGGHGGLGGVAGEGAGEGGIDAEGNG
jgi:hypothetical protein